MLSAWLYFPLESISDFVRARVIDPSSEYELFSIRSFYSYNNTLKVQSIVGCWILNIRS